MGIEDGLESASNIAGYWTIGVAKGVIVVLVPAIVASVGVGFILKVVRTGTKLGRSQ
jgi:hypothetical protein